MSDLIHLVRHKKILHSFQEFKKFTELANRVGQNPMLLAAAARVSKQSKKIRNVKCLWKMSELRHLVVHKEILHSFQEFKKFTELANRVGQKPMQLAAAARVSSQSEKNQNCKMFIENVRVETLGRA